MTHDPMCPQYDCWLEGCTVCDECALIARVREDERAAALDAAREAVVALPMMKIAGNFPLYDADEVIAAIDELKEKNND